MKTVKLMQLRAKEKGNALKQVRLLAFIEFASVSVQKNPIFACLPQSRESLVKFPLNVERVTPANQLVSDGLKMEDKEDGY